MSEKVEQSCLTSDVEKLVKETIVTEASCKVWEKFDLALSKMDAQNLALLKQFFGGISIASLSRERQVSEQQMHVLVERARHELVQHLRTCFHFKQ